MSRNENPECLVAVVTGAGIGARHPEDRIDRFRQVAAQPTR